MLDRNTIHQQLPYVVDLVDLDGLGPKIAGKVRDSYVVRDKRILITSDRLSAFDRILTTVPFKGQILNAMASYWFRETEHIVENHIIAEPHPNVLIAREAQILPVEVVVRGYLAGSAWRDYSAGRDVSGVRLPEGLRRSERLPEPVITPATKAEQGAHDEPISTEEVVERGLAPAKIWAEVQRYALQLFAFGTERAKSRGLILVDTKYEFGVVQEAKGPKIVLADEVHTPDSSRYWIAASYEQALERGTEPEMLDKEFVRSWLIAQGYMGEGISPVFTDDFRVEIASRYISSYEHLTGREFRPTPGPVTAEITASIAPYL